MSLHDDELPYHIKRDLIYKCKIRQSRENTVVLALVKKSPEDGPYLHEIQNKNMLTTWNLTETFLKGLPLVSGSTNQQNTNPTITITCNFVYTQTRRLMLYILKINEFLLILGKDHNTEMTRIYKQYENIKCFTITSNKTQHGQCNLILIKTDGSVTEEFNLKELIDCVHLKSGTHIQSVQQGVVKPTTSYIIEKLQTDLVKSKAELKAIKLQKRHLFNSLAIELKFGFSFIRGNTIEEKQMLAKYGDIWIKIHNQRLVLGIPVFNCTFARKRVLRNIHTHIISARSPNLIYTQHLYQCRLDSTGMFNLAELLQYDEMLSDDMTLKFNKEWIYDKNQNNLMPEMSGCLIVTMDQPHFHQKLPHSYQCFILYEIFDETTNKIHKFQNYAGEFSIKTDIIFNEKYFIQFNNSDCFFKDLLAVTATSELQVYDIHFDNKTTVKHFFDEIIVKQLNFSLIKMNLTSNTAENITLDNSSIEIDAEISKKPNNDNDLMEVDDEIDDLFNFHQRRPIQNQNNSTIGLTINKDCKATLEYKLNDIFFQNNSGYFKGMLIRRNEINELQYRIKIYCRSNENGLDLIELIKEQLNKLIKITQIYRNIHNNGLMAVKEFYKAFQTEVDFVLKNYSQNDITCESQRIDELINLRMERLQLEYETDKKLNQLNSCKYN